MTATSYYKLEAARRALAEVRDGMTLGLGSGSTSAIFVDLLGQAVQQGQVAGIRGVATSEKTAAQARGLGIDLIPLAQAARLDLAIDGADEVDPQLQLIKGLGKALLREKLVEIHSARLLIIIDESKISSRLGRLSPLPVEIVPYAWEKTVAWLAALQPDVRAELWRAEDGEPFVTDNGNYLARCWFADGIEHPHRLARTLADRPGVVEHGLFLDMAAAVIVAGANGIQIWERKR
ncbi:MAG: ribose 5-phosphate isomerase A [Caldilineales bacterium]|nr:ribose 5-phosphate isomerase A [Caldilineales bacterium]MCW5859369.1 ribose 5-phosphate isomerase A [Caldilineales bacterium]